MISFLVPSSTELNVPEDMRAELERMRSQSSRLRISIEPAFKDRTMSQNSYFHSKINQIAKGTGMPRDSVKRIVKGYAMGMGYPMERDKEGRIQFDQDGEPKPLSTARASIQEMTILIDALYAWASENDIYLEDFE